MTTEQLRMLHQLLESCKNDNKEHFEGDGDQAIRIVDGAVCRIILKQTMSEQPIS